MKRSIINLLLSCLLLLLCCDDEEETGFHGIILRDATGLAMGTKGSSDLDDWEQDSSLPGKIKKRMDNLAASDLTGTDYALIDIVAYPNPCVDAAYVEFDVEGGPCELKIVVVNESNEVLYNTKYVGSSTTHSFDLSDPDKVPNNSIVRIYYAFSQESDNYFYVGHGDIWVCRTGDCL